MQQDAQAIEFDKYYNAMKDLFLSEGWDYLMKDLTANANHINSVESVKDNEELFHRKGQLTILANLLNLENQLETLRQQQEEAEIPEEA